MRIDFLNFDEMKNNLPKGWVWVRLGEVISNVSLSGKKLKKSEYQEAGKYPVIDQGQTFVGGYSDREDFKIFSDTPLIIFGDHTKVFKYIDFQFIAGADGVKVIKPKEIFYPKLFYYFAQAIPLPEKGYARHYQWLEKSLIPLPPLPEQHRIVAKIEELFTRLDAGVEALKKVKAQLKRYRQAVLKYAFEGKLTQQWREVNKDKLEPASVLLERIKNVRANLRVRPEPCDICVTQNENTNVGANLRVRPDKGQTHNIKGQTHRFAPTNELPELPDGWVWTRLGEVSEINPKFNREGFSADMDVTFLPMKCVEEFTGRIDLSITKKLSEVSKGYTSFEEGDLLFAKITPCMENGKIAIAHRLKNGIGFGSTEFHVIRLDKSLLPKFFFFFLIQEELRKDAQRNMTGSAGQLRVPANFMRQIPIPLPPLPEQHKIVEEIESRFSIADNIEKVVEQSLKQAERLRQSILKRAFEGKLVPQDPSDEPAEKLLERVKKEKESRDSVRQKSRRRK